MIEPIDPKYKVRSAGKYDPPRQGWKDGIHFFESSDRSERYVCAVYGEAVNAKVNGKFCPHIYCTLVLDRMLSFSGRYVNRSYRRKP